MRNLGAFFPDIHSITELTELGQALGGEVLDAKTLLFGEPPDAAYLALSTSLSDGCFDESECRRLEAQFGFAPAAYISVHIGSTSAAYDRALGVAKAICQRWSGTLDYSGAGGTHD